MRQTDKRKLLSLRQKAIASLVLVFVILISYFLYFTVVNQHRSYEEEVRNAAQMKAEFVSLAISEYLFQKDRAFSDSALEYNFHLVSFLFTSKKEWVRTCLTSLPSKSMLWL